MAPIHESDIAENRWSQAEWKHYELWEKVEQRLNRRKWLWISGTILLFLALSAVPVIRDRSPKWTSQAAARRLAREVSMMKRDAAIQHAAFRLRFGDPTKDLSFVVEKGTSCSGSDWVAVRSGKLTHGRASSSYALVQPELGAELGVPGLASAFCYDSLSGSEALLRGVPVVGFAVAPAQDLMDKRSDRMSVVLLSGPSAEPNFE